MKRLITPCIAIVTTLLVCSARAQQAPYASPPGYDTEPAEEDIRRFTAKLSAGPTVHALYDNPVYGADLTLALGGNATSHPGHYYGRLSAMLGRTAGGLAVEQVRIGPMLEWSLERLRFGASPELGTIIVHKVTSSDTMRAYSIGLRAHVSIDLYQFMEDEPPASALYASLEGGFDYLFDSEPDTALGGGSLALGFRY
jgi:hypothetical protein